MTDLAAQSASLKRRRRRVVVGVALFAAVGVAVFLRGWPRAPVPPNGDPELMEPAVAHAVETARAQVLRHPRSAAAWGLLGQVFIGNEMDEEGRLCFIEAERLDPTDPRWPYYQAGAFVNRGEHEPATELFRRSAARSRADNEAGATVRLRLAEILIILDAPAEAESAIREVLDAHPDDPRAHLAMASLCELRQQWEQAKEHLLRCTNSPYTRRKARLQLAEILERLGQRREAEPFLAEAARMPVDAGWPDPWVAECVRFAEKKRERYRLAQNLETAGRFAEAADLIRPMTQSFPDDYLAFLTLGKVLAQANDLEGAEQAMRRAVELSPQVLQAHYYLSVILLRRGDALARKGEQTRAQDYIQQARDHARKALQQKSDYGYALMAEGLALRKLGRKEEAFQSLRAAVKCNPEHADLHLHLADMLAAEGLREEARHALEEAQRVAIPGDPRPATALERLNAGTLPILD